MIEPMLEVIAKGACTAAHPVPLLFVHGAWHGAWCWDQGFLDYFADNGHRTLAVSLRGHGGSPSAKPLRRCSVADYVDDVAAVADGLPTPPVVIGHSMGGFVVQKYLESHDAPAAVLLASLPPRGLRGQLLELTRRHPRHAVRAMLTGRTLQNVNTPELAREKLFSAQTPEALVAACAASFGEESARALFVDMLFWNLPKPQRVSTPILVLGAAADGVIPVDDVHDTAHAYRTEAEIFPGMGHDMMLEPGWQAVAQRIDGWLAEIRIDTTAGSHNL